jgi:hydrogenase nickel incorporation protein HypB
MCDSCGCHLPDKDHHHHEQNNLVIDVHQSLLEANNEQAEKNREHFKQLGAVAINMISSPGSGKTTLLERTIEMLGKELRIGVLEGDIETDRDAERIRAKGVPVVQITTGGACHLDARLVHKALHQLTKESNQDTFDLIFIENVGNLVCPATFDLGEQERVVLVSVPEGPDKPAKYPKAFHSSQLFLITKTDLLPHFDFSLDEAIDSAKKHNHDLEVIALSSTSGDNMENWLGHLRSLCH